MPNPKVRHIIWAIALVAAASASVALLALAIGEIVTTGIITASLIPTSLGWAIASIVLAGLIVGRREARRRGAPPQLTVRVDALYEGVWQLAAPVHTIPNPDNITAQDQADWIAAALPDDGVSYRFSVWVGPRERGNPDGFAERLLTPVD